MVTMGNVTLVNPRPFDSTAATTSNTTFTQSFMTSSTNLMSYISVIAKGSSANGTPSSTLSVAITAPTGNGPVNPGAQLFYQTMGRCLGAQEEEGKQVCLVS